MFFGSCGLLFVFGFQGFSLLKRLAGPVLLHCLSMSTLEVRTTDHSNSSPPVGIDESPDSIFVHLSNESSITLHFTSKSSSMDCFAS